MDGESQVVDGAGSAPASEPQASGTDPLNTGNGHPAQAEGPFHQHPRWQQMLRERNEARAQAAQHGQSLQQLQQELAILKRQAQAPAGSPEEQFQSQQAIAALTKLFDGDPKLKRLLDLAEHADRLLQTPDAIQQFGHSQAETQRRSAVTHIRGLAEKAGLDTDDESLGWLVAAVRQAALRLPDARQRYDSGDLGVLDDAFKQIHGKWFGPRPTAPAIVAAKRSTSNLPPRPAGGSINRDAPPDIAKVGEKGVWKDMRDRAVSMASGRS